MIKKFQKQAGMTLFIAVVVMSILLFISFAAANIALKATIFATSGKDSQFAFYAADAGIECAVYWDSKFDSFATSTVGSPPPRTISCAGLTMADGNNIAGTSTITLIGRGTDANPTSKFGFVMNQPIGAAENRLPHCAIVTVTKYYADTNGDGFQELVTYIKSRGYNNCDSSRRVERGVEVTY